MKAWLARTLVFGSSAAVLVLEILAGRLLAPYVGVSLETFTGIIGVVLAGIALGSWAGGALADQRDASAAIGPALALGGALAWLSLPIIRGLGPQFGDGPVAVLILTTAAFFLPSAVLSSVSPMVAKLRLRDLSDTGSVVGGLSAAGTIGALAGTFITGFVLISAIPTRPIVVMVGALLVAGGAVTHWALSGERPTVGAAVLVLLAGVGGVTSSSPCQFETGYACVTIEVDPNNPSGRSLYLDQLRHAYVDLDDPTVLDIRYIRLFAQVTEPLDPQEPLRTLHLGGGGFSFPQYLQHVRGGGFDLVLEIDPDLVDIAEDELGFVQTPDLQVRTGDARNAVDELPSEEFDLVVGDAFGGSSVPWHLTTREFLEEVDRVLRADGLYVMNVIDGGANRFARAQVATLRQVFEHVRVVVPSTGIPELRRVNQVLIASQSPIPEMEIASADGRLVPDQDLDAFVDGARALRDDFAPVDQLLFS